MKNNLLYTRKILFHKLKKHKQKQKQKNIYIKLCFYVLLINKINNYFFSIY